MNQLKHQSCSLRGDLFKGLLAGVIGGIVASLVMEQFQALFTKVSESLEQSKKEGSESNGEREPATVQAAEAITESFLDRGLKEDEKQAAGEAVHYATGATSGAIYGIMAELTPVVTRGWGLPFGTAVWAIADNVAVPALGLSKSPRQYPLSTHAYALSSHLVYGLTTDIVRRGIRRALLS